jgi:TolB-like protein
MSKSKIIFAVIIALSMTVPSFAREKMQIAVLDLHPKGVSKILANAVSDIVRSEMVKSGMFTVIERTQMDEILREQGFQMTGCTDQACAVKVGKILSARKILIGEVNKVGQAFIITIRIVDVETSVSEFAANEKAMSEDMLDKAGANITRKLAENIYEGNRAYFAFVTPAGYYSRGIVPGWGQIYAGHPVKGGIILGTFIAAVGASTWGLVNYLDKAKEYDDVPRTPDQSAYDDKFEAKKNAGIMMFSLLGATGAVYLFNWIDILFFSKPDFGDKKAEGGFITPFFSVSTVNTFNGHYEPYLVMQINYNF